MHSEIYNNNKKMRNQKVTTLFAILYGQGVSRLDCYQEISKATGISATTVKRILKANPAL